ncbi:bacillithiol biosynthesis cysteine-adding enzyme BshC [Metabacillus indicus]|uniref:Putative cysteine ligase BshC n=1 Tax=Metabacillus indicus TaxID=246786 RepID=A0A084H3I1_METID|nr:bacillithiol biosynthesis cysteine-adding enzyme BshC [Metabacillus indicus]KEZ49986.1 hypothetical protein AZ46_0204560 [Metabacillus indicus LMG 22858]KEZ54143.1 hypothetical protein GS18_0204245 [Metabacillus indicus]
MEITDLSLRHSNRLVEDLISGRLNTADYFDYSITDDTVYEQRVKDLKNRTFAREELSSYLLRYHQKHFQDKEPVIRNIERLKDPESLVVVGGQQAGLLTGPLYTIHKIISILVLAEQQEAKLSVPVIPVFWVAGEDHDFAEVNHLHVSQNGVIKKKAVKTAMNEKIPVFYKNIDHEECWNFICSIFETFGETDYTMELMNSLKQTLSVSATYTEFFEHLTYEMFSDYGLVLINSSDPELRKMEAGFFQHLILKNEELSESLSAQQAFMKEAGYKPIIEADHTSANLFYHDSKGDRLLLKRTGDSVFSAEGQSFTEAELKQFAEQYPERLSNNVVTRPLMQEYLLPTLAFIAGPGEISYWAELKRVFDTAGFHMPPVVPRLNITIVERSIESDMREVSLTIDDLFSKGADKVREEWLAKMEPSQLTPEISQAKTEIERIHKNLRESAVSKDASLEPFLEKNAFFIQSQLDLLQSYVDKKIQQKHRAELDKFTRIAKSLQPNGGFQERTWNIYYYLNKYGPHFVHEIVKLRYSFNFHHKVVKI